DNQPTSDEDTTSENSESDQLFAEAKLRLYRKEKLNQVHAQVTQELVQRRLQEVQLRLATSSQLPSLEISTPFEFKSTQETPQAFNYNEEEEHNPAHIFPEENYSEETPETQLQLLHHREPQQLQQPYEEPSTLTYFPTTQTPVRNLPQVTYSQGETFAESSRTSSQPTKPQQFIIPLSEDDEDATSEETQVINSEFTHELANLEEEAASVLATLANYFGNLRPTQPETQNLPENLPQRTTDFPRTQEEIESIYPQDEAFPEIQLAKNNLENNNNNILNFNNLFNFENQENNNLPGLNLFNTDPTFKDLENIDQAQFNTLVQALTGLTAQLNNNTPAPAPTLPVTIPLFYGRLYENVNS
ncbi:28824_t:CDS:2, partial [Dentiscutata erythropus]